MTMFVSADVNWAVIGTLNLKFHFTEYFSLANISKLAFQMKINSCDFRMCMNKQKDGWWGSSCLWKHEKFNLWQTNFELIKSGDHFILFSSNSPKPQVVHTLKLKLINHGTKSHKWDRWTDLYFESVFVPENSSTACCTGISKLWGYG